MKNGKRVASALRAGKDGGIPWFVFLDPSKPLLKERELQEGETVPALLRRKAAVLATADAAEGNVGCPVSESERAHFVGCIAKTRKTLSDKQLARFEELLAAFASTIR